MNLINISNYNDERLDVYARLTEAQIMHPQKGTGQFIAESPVVIERALEDGYTPISLLVEEKQVEKHMAGIIQKCGDIPVFTSSIEILENIIGYKLTRGVLCAMERKPLKSVNEIINHTKRITVLEDVMNPTNMGAIFRSAAALGMEAVLLSPGCCDPLYRRCIRVSMGTVFQIPWAYVGDEMDDWPLKGIELLRNYGYKTVAMALRNDTVDINDSRLNNEEKLAIILGTEGTGLCEQTIDSCDYTVKIPMYNGVDSLNVAAASAVAFYQLGKKKSFE